MSALKYWLWLTRLPGLRNQSRHALLRHFVSPEDIYYADEEELRLVEGLDREQAGRLSNHSLENADRILGECQRLDIRLLTMQDAGYPGRLRDIYDPPCLLYVKGTLPVIDEEAVIAVVGTRSCTPYGVACAERLSYGLTTGGCIVASGLARGIDSAASRGALMAGGVTLGLVGNGLDVVYPKESAALYEDIAAAGALISEYPPGTKPLPGHFPQRNRILSGISVGALVVEAPLRSGALITAHTALDQGRDVFSVPGPIDAPASRGSNRLIQEGAALVTDAREIIDSFAARFPEKLQTGAARELPAVLEEPGQDAPAETGSPAGTGAPVEAKPAVETISLNSSGLTDDQIVLMRLLDLEKPVQADDLIEFSGIPARRVLSALTVLEIDGLVRQHSGKRYTRLVNYREN